MCDKTILGVVNGGQDTRGTPAPHEMTDQMVKHFAVFTTDFTLQNVILPLSLRKFLDATNPVFLAMGQAFSGHF